MLHFSNPTNALKRAEELVSVGQKDAALVALHDVLSSKRHRTWQPAIEEVMTKFLDICVDMKKGKAAKDGLVQYRIICQQINVASMEHVLRYFMQLAEEETRNNIMATPTPASPYARELPPVPFFLSDSMDCLGDSDSQQWPF